MKIFLKAIFLVPMAALCLAVMPSNAAETFDARRLAWLEGLWVGEKGGIDMEERWTSAKGNALLGMHRDVKNGRMVSFEFFRIDATPAGIFYFASPRGTPATPFRLTSLNDKQVVFENKEHDFPQRIAYALDAQGALHASIEGPMNGKWITEEWVWRKAER
jgi:hypothetical protein